MENPSQSAYAPEELFTLKPQDIEIKIAKPELPIATGVEYPIVISPESPIAKAGFWNSYKWYIIGGGIILLGTATVFIYRAHQKRKKNEQKD